MDMFYHLPKEIMEEILLRLPPKSLVRFKCVCKSWNLLINDPSFINKHLLSCTTLFLTGKKLLSPENICNDKSDNISFLIEEFDIPGSNKYPLLWYFPHSHCNGIICVCPYDIFEETIILCNPAIKELKVLPKSFFNKDSINREIGFGYDSISCDYKVVRIFTLGGKWRNEVSKAEVFTLGTDSWREIRTDINFRCCLSSRGRYYKGVYYWWNILSPIDYDDMIVSFDMHEEKFKSIPLPDYDRKKMGFGGWKSLTIWNESLALFVSRKSPVMSLFLEMWVMVDNLNGSSWIKHLTIEPLERVHFPLAFWKKDELFMESPSGEIVTYNLFTKKLRKLPIDHVKFRFTHVDFYVKSLVSVKGGSKLKSQQQM
ncbi:hypothetical protein UlMin_037945 [Ulmus minor]